MNIMANKRTNSNSSKDIVEEWVPTAGQQKLIKVMMDPYHRMSSVTRICELAGVSRDTYYSAMKDERFASFYRDQVLGDIKAKAGQLINMGIREARKGGQAGFGYWKELLKMGGLTEGDKALEVNMNGPVTIRFADPETHQADEENDDD